MILPETGRGTIGRRANGGGGVSLRKPAVYAARKLRRQMSPPEVLLWDQLRGSKLGFKVRRQHPIGPYVADFFVRGAGFVIEIDGGAHDFGDRPERDEKRERYITERGYRVVRLGAGDVMKNLDGVLKFIVEQVTNPLHHPSDGPSPHAGEDF
jgi:very-short-patch-repair endonuclease